MIDVISRTLRRSGLFSVCLVAALTAACSNSQPAAAPAETAGTGSNTIAVTTAVAHERNVPLAIEVPGTFAADESSDVAAEGAGRVVATPVDIGHRVRRGDVLVRLDDRDARLRLEQARAALQQAQAALGQARDRHRLAATTAARYEGLLKTGDVSRAVYDQLTTETQTTEQAVATAEAAIVDVKSRIALAEKALADTVIHAPFDGFVTSRTATVGEYVGPGTRIATVMRLDPIKLRMQVPEVSAAQVRQGQRVTAQVEALGGATVTGTVRAVNAALDPATRAVLVEATVPNSDGRVRAEMFAAAHIELGRSEPGVFVPSAAVLPDPNTNSYQVYVIDKGIARLRVVQIGGSDAQQVRIRSGIAAEEAVAISNLEELFDGARVAPTPGRPAGNASPNE